MSGIFKLWSRAQEIQRENGLPALFKASFRFLCILIYERKLFYLYERPVKVHKRNVEAQPNVDPQDLHFVVISSNEQADNLEKDGYAFRTYPTDWNYGSMSYSKWLNKGAIAFCTFVGKEFAAINWIILSENVQKRITLPLKVDYSSGEAYPRGAWVNPKYRGLGLIRYNFINRDRYLLPLGVKLLRSTVEYRNTTGKGMVEALDSRIYGQARLVKILWWKFWKETYSK